jgi:hypothetical protein
LKTSNTSSNSSTVLKSLCDAVANEQKYNGNTFLVYVASIPLNPTSFNSKGNPFIVLSSGMGKI